MKSNDLENIYSPRRNDINEDNLNFLNEEASQYIDENQEEDFRQKSNSFGKKQRSFEDSPGFKINSKYRTSVTENIYNKNANNVFNEFAEDEVSNLNNEDDINYLKYKTEELHKDLIDKLNKINALNEQIKNKDVLIQTLKKNISNMQEKLAITEKYKIHMNMQNKQIAETENEANIIKAEYLKIQETMNNKDHLIGEFQKLSEVTKNKFKLFENKNHILNEEVMNLNQIIEDLKFKLSEYAQRDIEKDSIIQEIRSARDSYEKTYEEQKVDLLKKEEKLRLRFEEKEKELKFKQKEKEELLKEEYILEIKNLNKKMDEIKLENDRFKFENLDLKSIIDDYENAKHEREIEFKREILLRENDYEKLQKTIRDLQADIEELESRLAEKANDFNIKIKNTEQNENKIVYQLTQKDKKIKEQEDEISSLKNLILDLQSSNRDYEIKLENKHKYNEQLKKKNEDLSQEIKNLENEIGNIQQNNMKELEQITVRFTDLTNEKENLVFDNEDLKSGLLKATTRIRELNEIIELKYQGIENQLIKEKTSKENLERKYRDLQKKYNLNYESLINENNDLKNTLEKKQIELENIKTKYETKIHKLKMKLDEQEYSKDQILGDVNNMKDWATNFDKKYEQLNYSEINNPHTNYIKLDPTPSTMKETRKRIPSMNMNQEDNHKNLLDNFRDIIDKIDNKIYGNNNKTQPNQSFYRSKNDLSYRNFDGERPVENMN